MYEQSRSFDPERYVRQKTLQIIKKNGGTKLTLETLAKIANTGLRLVPPINT